MSRNTNKEWERRKWHLVRSLFDNEPLLSPIPETQEQSLSPTEVSRSRPYSPLPDLIIEKEPNRHDEPEEYYLELEKRIKKIYRRLFHNTSQDSLTEYINELNVIHGANIEDEAIEERTQSEHSSSGSRHSSERRCSREKSVDKNESTHSSSHNHSGSKDSMNFSVEHSSINGADSSSIKNLAINKSTNSSSSDSTEVNSNSSVESSKLIKHNDKSKLSDERQSTRSILEESDTSSESISQHKIIVTTAQIHYTGSKLLLETRTPIETASLLDRTTGDDQPATHYSLVEKSEERRSTDINAVSTNTEISEAVEEQSEEQESLQFSAHRDENMERACSKASDGSSTDEPETMRRLNTRNISLQSVYAVDDRRCSLPSEELVEPSGRGEMEAEASADFSLILGSSTPKVTSQEQRYSKRRNLSAIFSNHGETKRIKNVTTQTSFSTTDDENDWQEIRKTFFVGNPVVYKLCKCRNHVCW